MHVPTGIGLYWGGVNPSPHVKGTGQAGDAARAFLQDAYPDHAVSRADVASDVDEPGAFDRIVALVDPIARKSGVKVTFIGDPGDPEKPPEARTGRSMYFGSEKSDVRLVIYEKGLEQIAKGVLGQHSPNWVRIELRVRPRKGRKATTGRLELAQMYGMAKWTMEVARHLDLASPNYSPDISMRESTAEKAFRAMTRQYRATIIAMQKQHSREWVLERIGNVMDEAS